MATEKRRLIDANALHKEIEEIYDLNYGETLTDPYRFAELVEDAPTVEAVEVVRCKDCKGWCAEEIAKQYGVDRYCTMTTIPTNADDFCSYGERRTDNG